MPAFALYFPWVSTLFFAGWAIYLKGHSNRVRVTDKHDALIERMRSEIQDLKIAQARTESPLMKQVQDLLSAGLHHPDPSYARQDILLEKLDKTTLTASELPELKAMLEAQITDPSTPTRDIEATKAILAIMPLVVKEQAIIERVEETKRHELG